MGNMETKLMCSATNCVNNADGLCAAYIIRIQDERAENSDETYCDNFAEKGVENALKNMFNMNLYGEIQQVADNDSVKMSPQIKCNAKKCMYNFHEMCKAKYISISDKDSNIKSDTNCETFRIK